MNGKPHNLLSFVGAMKIARTVAVSGRHVEWHAPIPGSLSEGAGSPQGLTEGVSSDGCSMPTIHKPAHINSEIFERLRSSKYTPSASASLRQLPQRGSRGGAVPFNGVLAKIPGYGRFSSPLRNSKDLTSYHSIGYSLKSRVAGDFHRPYEKSGGMVRRFLGGDYVAAAFKGRMGARVEMACL